MQPASPGAAGTKPMHSKHRRLCVSLFFSCFFLLLFPHICVGFVFSRLHSPAFFSSFASCLSHRSHSSLSRTYCSHSHCSQLVALPIRVYSSWADGLLVSRHVTSRHVRSGQVRSGQVRSGHVMSWFCPVMLCMLCYVMPRVVTRKERPCESHPTTWCSFTSLSSFYLSSLSFSNGFPPSSVLPRLSVELYVSTLTGLLCQQVGISWRCCYRSCVLNEKASSCGVPWSVRALGLLDPCPPDSFATFQSLSDGTQVMSVGEHPY